jgi:hypothetical protein
MIAHAAGVSPLLVHVKGCVVRWMNPELGSHNMFIEMRAEWIRKLSRGAMGELFLGPRLSPPAPPSSRSMKRNRGRLKAQATAQTVLLRWIPPVSQWEARSPGQSCAAANVTIARVIAKRVPIWCKPSDSASECEALASALPYWLSL